MKMYHCKLCMDLYPDFCTACVPDETPDIFDKSIMNVFCLKENKKPLWWMRKDYESF
jgi:hypothetical protein